LHYKWLRSIFIKFALYFLTVINLHPSCQDCSSSQYDVVNPIEHRMNLTNAATVHNGRLPIADEVVGASFSSRRAKVSRNR
jgi:hypothetical protein